MPLFVRFLLFIAVHLDRIAHTFVSRCFRMRIDAERGITISGIADKSRAMLFLLLLVDWGKNLHFCINLQPPNLTPENFTTQKVKKYCLHHNKSQDL